jgi:predicted nucleotidyltransferase
MSLDRLLRSVTDLIVTVCDPDKVVLFGSYAKGRENLESDLDILIVGTFAGFPYQRGKELRELLHLYHLRIDLHLATPNELEYSACANPHGYLTTALAGGVVLYDKFSIDSQSRL